MQENEKKTKAEKRFEEKGIVYIPSYKKVWYSMRNFERYPEMAAEGVGRAIKYLAVIMLFFGIVIGIASAIKFNQTTKQIVGYIEENVSDITYEKGILNVDTKETIINVDGNKFIINTGDLEEAEQTKLETETTANNPGIICLKDKIIVKVAGNKSEYGYDRIFSTLNIEKFNKEDLLNYFNQILQSPKVYLIYFGLMFIYVFIIYMISSLIDVLTLSIFGIIAAWAAKIKMRYRAIFNMSVYAITISLMLELIYIIVRMFTDFEIKHFDLMYTAISIICLTAAIFMIKSDVIKQQIELIKIMQKNQEEIEEEKKEDKEEKEEEKEDKETEKKENKKDKNTGEDNNPQGSNA